MKVNHLPGSYRSEQASASERRKKAEAHSASSSAAHDAGRDEYIQKSDFPLMSASALYEAFDTDQLSGRVNELLLKAGGSGGGAGSQKAYHLRISRMPDYGKGVSAGTAALLTIDVYRQGFQSGYTAEDAAVSLWQREYTVINVNDPPSLARLGERVRAGNFSLSPTAEELTAYMERLRRDGLSGDVDWRALARELGSFAAVRPDELADSLDYLASRYAAVKDKLFRSCSGDTLAAEREKLESVWEAGTSRMIDNYTADLRESLSLSDTRSVRESFTVLLTERTAAYETALERVRKSVGDHYPKDVWLQNHDAFMAAKLRETVNISEETAARYSAKDLAYAGGNAQASRWSTADRNHMNGWQSILAALEGVDRTAEPET